MACLFQIILTLRIIQEHLEKLHDEITSIVSSSREGRILLLIPHLVPIQAATIIMPARAPTVDCEWARMYQRLLPRIATYDERTKEHHGTLKVIVRFAEQVASLIFALLKTDQELLLGSHIYDEIPTRHHESEWTRWVAALPMRYLRREGTTWHNLVSTI